jgi:hypothetical protein
MTTRPRTRNKVSAIDITQTIKHSTSKPEEITYLVRKSAKKERKRKD